MSDLYSNQLVDTLAECKTYYDLEKKNIHDYYFVDIQGNLEGEYNEFHKNGQLALKGFYVKNKRDGVFQEWDEEGKLILYKCYSSDILNGVCQEMVNGKLILDKFYINGVAIDSLCENDSLTGLAVQGNFLKLQKDMENLIEMNRVKDEEIALMRKLNKEKDEKIRLMKAFQDRKIALMKKRLNKITEEMIDLFEE